MKFSLVTTCFNEMKSLPRWKSDVLSQTRRPDEIVIVDSFSSDGTLVVLKEWAEEDSRVKLIIEKCSVAKGRNIAIREASHEYVVSTDLGVRIDPRWYEEIVLPFEADSTVEIVAGSSAVDEDSVKSVAARAEYYIEGDGRPNFGPELIPGNRSVGYSKKLWSELGGLPEDLTMCADDSVFFRQMLQGGYKLAFAPKALVYWTRPSAMKAFWKEHYNYGRGDGEAAIKTPVAFRFYKKGYLPNLLVPYVTGLRQAIRVFVFRGILKALGDLDLGAAILLPIFMFGRGFWYAKGYLIGDEHGLKNCLDCRSRLTKKS